MYQQTLFAQHSFSRYLILIVLCISLFSCKESNESQPDVSSVTVQLNTRRLDKELKALDTNQLAEGLVRLQKQYPDFLNFYLDTLMGFNINGNYTPDNKGINEGLRSFLTFKDYSDLFDTVSIHYPSTEDVEKELIKGFQYLQHYYPAYKVPKVVYFVSGLSNWGVVSYDGVLGIGLDIHYFG